MRTPQNELERRCLNERGRQILLRKEGKAVRPSREDGYVNMMNKYGTQQDNSEAYRFERESIIPDMQLTGLYEGNGLFAKIIDAPAEEALKHGFDLGLKNDELDTFVEDALDALEWEEKAATAIKWARLYGGSIIVMLIDDGRGLEEPVDWKKIRSIDELRVYERAVVQPDYQSLYLQDYGRRAGNRVSKFGRPEFYHVSSVYGSFTVHESRCLLFRNGVLPELTTNTTYRLWGMPEYIRIQRSLRETLTAHGDSVKLLERSVQAIYSMKNLAQLLATDDGENQVLKRLQIIDMARGLLNSIAIDSEGENYDFKVAQFSGVKDVIDATCNMLSALTNIPQTILFGRSPAGMNSTGDSDLENWYSFVGRVQKLMLKQNLRILLDVIFRAGVVSGDIKEEPDYKLKFNPLWSLSDAEQATVDQTKAQTAQIKAQTAQIYVDMQAIDPQEVRKGLAADEDFDVEDIVSEDESEDLLRALYGSNPLAEEETEGDQKNQKQVPGGGEQSETGQLVPKDIHAKVDCQDDLKSKVRTATIYLDDDGEWVTMNGTHVLIEEGKVVGGPPNLKGKPHKPKQKSGSAGERQTESSTIAKKEYHPEVSETDSKNLSSYGKRNQKEAPQIIDAHKEIDEQIRVKYGESQMTTEEFVQKSSDAFERWSEEDRMLDAAYTVPIVGKENPLGIEYAELNRKLREKQPLTDDEQAVVDHFKRCAEPLGKDTDLYRYVGTDYVSSLLGTQIELPDSSLFKALDSDTTTKIESLQGKEIVNGALQSTCIGASTAFSGNRVAIKIKVPGDTPVCFTSDVSEGEVVIPSGAKMRITSARYIQPPSIKNDTRMQFPKWNSIRGMRAVRASRATDAGLTEKQQYFAQGIYIEMELIGYE